MVAAPQGLVFVLQCVSSTRCWTLTYMRWWAEGEPCDPAPSAATPLSLSDLGLLSQSRRCKIRQSGWTRSVLNQLHSHRFPYYTRFQIIIFIRGLGGTVVRDQSSKKKILRIYSEVLGNFEGICVNCLQDPSHIYMFHFSSRTSANQPPMINYKSKKKSDPQGSSTICPLFPASALALLSWTFSMFGRGQEQALSESRRNTWLQ